MRLLKLDTSSWQKFIVKDLFAVSGTKTTSQNELEEYGTGKYPYVTTQATNNGASKFYNYYTEKGNVLTIDSAVTGYCSYQPLPFSASDHVEKLTPLFELNKHIGLFLTVIFNMEQYKYSYGRKFNQKKIKQTTIKLPVTNHGSPDWLYMEQYIKSLKYKPVSTKITALKVPLLAASQWGEYKLGELFKFCKGKRLTKEDILEGEINFIGAISENNGVRQLITALENFPLFQPNCITVNYNGSVGEAFYQNEPFWASDDVNVLYARNWELNPHTAMFLITVIKANRYKFSYGRKWTLDKMKKSFVRLPKAQSGLPDWLYMEKYIKSLPYSDKI